MRLVRIEDPSQRYFTMFQSEELVDVTLVCDDGRRIKAHKLVLSAGSSYFRQIFRSEHVHHLMYLQDVAYQDLESILEFLYLGATKVANKNIENFMKLAGRLKINELLMNNPFRGYCDKPPIALEENFANTITLNESFHDDRETPSSGYESKVSDFVNSSSALGSDRLKQLKKSFNEYEAVKSLRKPSQSTV